MPKYGFRCLPFGTYIREFWPRWLCTRPPASSDFHFWALTTRPCFHPPSPVLIGFALGSLAVSFWAQKTAVLGATQVCVSALSVCLHCNKSTCFITVTWQMKGPLCPRHQCYALVKTEMLPALRYYSDKGNIRACLHRGLVCTELMHTSWCALRNLTVCQWDSCALFQFASLCTHDGGLVCTKHAAFHVCIP